MKWRRPWIVYVNNNTVQFNSTHDDKLACVRMCSLKNWFALNTGHKNLKCKCVCVCERVIDAQFNFTRNRNCCAWSKQFLICFVFALFRVIFNMNDQQYEKKTACKCSGEFKLIYTDIAHLNLELDFSVTYKQFRLLYCAMCHGYFQAICKVF